jgi:glycerophosphoryl diester phosphodiesterase
MGKNMRHYFLIVFFCFSVFKFGFSQNTYIAHRGASYIAPENTLASAKLAWELGADAVEIDVHLSADNQVMVIHDNDTKRVSQRKSNLKISETPSDLLRTIDVGSFKSDEYAGEKIPFIEEVLKTVPPGGKLVVEIKCGTEVFPALKKAIDESGKIGQIIFISFNWDVVLKAHEMFPENECYYLKMFPFGLKAKMKAAAEKGLTGVNLYHKIITKRVVEQASEQGLEVLAWTVDEPEVVKRLNDLGVTTVTTNRPGWLKKQVENN